MTGDDTGPITHTHTYTHPDTPMQGDGAETHKARAE